MPTELDILYEGNCIICDIKPPGEERLCLCDECWEEVYAYSFLGNKAYINEQIGCPICNTTNDSDLWDRHTRENWALHEIRIYPWIIVKKEIHEKMRLHYRCPTCNQIVDGVDLIREIYK